MSEDIAQRLRCLPVDCDGTCHTCAAADEIERLRRWKTDATYVLDAWQEAWESAGISGSLGATKSEAMLDEITRLRAEVTQLTAESEEWDADTERHVARMAGLLHDTANALHGGPLAGGMWSWHDLPDLASAERALADQLAKGLRGEQELLSEEGVGLISQSSAALAAYEAARRGEP